MPGPGKADARQLDHGNGRFAPLDATWKTRFASLEPEEQRSEIAVELRRRNPDYRRTPYRNEQLTKPDLFTNIGVFTDDIRDITPLAAVRSLTHVQLISSAWMANEKKGRLESIEPLRGLKLEFLDLKFNGALSDLAPLAGMKLSWLNLTGTGIRDLEALRKVDLTGGLLIEQTAVADLRPIADKPLWELRFADTAVKDLTPLKGMHLETVSLAKDAAPWTVFAGMPLKHLFFTPDGKQNVDVFRQMPALETINGKPAAEFWREFDSSSKRP
jgi:hypothetical protein